MHSVEMQLHADVPPGYAHAGANLWSVGNNYSGSMCVPNLKCVALSVCEILRGSQISNFCHVTHAP